MVVVAQESGAAATVANLLCHRSLLGSYCSVSVGEDSAAVELLGID